MPRGRLSHGGRWLYGGVIPSGPHASSGPEGGATGTGPAALRDFTGAREEIPVEIRGSPGEISGCPSSMEDAGLFQEIQGGYSCHFYRGRSRGQG